MTKTTIALLALVTAAVTIIGGCTLLIAQVPGQYSVVITNRATGHKLTYNKRSFQNPNTCDDAIRGLTERLNGFAALAGLSDEALVAAQVPDAPDADPVIAESVDMLVLRITDNAGLVPNLSISCELPGDPA